ncbi:MAG: DUF167 domain-containing protein [Alphaproteobacteria bacterium]|nr:DUF167 domain-containing protein [Alphaproteobacteria bacterium]
MNVYEKYKSGYLLRIKLTPNASFCGFKDKISDAEGVLYLKAYVQSVPEKGRANDELIKLLAKKLKIAKNCISIISGQTEHYKKIYLDVSVSEDDMIAMIGKITENN